MKDLLSIRIKMKEDEKDPLSMEFKDLVDGTTCKMTTRFTPVDPQGGEVEFIVQGDDKCRELFKQNMMQKQLNKI